MTEREDHHVRESFRMAPSLRLENKSAVTHAASEWLFDKGRDCEAAGGEHHWYNTDDKHSACYYCQVIREGQLWK
jgi:hypothetical protein